MPARTRGNTTLSTMGGIVAPPVRIKAIEDEIKQTVESRMRERLGVPPRQALPDEVVALVASAAATAAQRSIELGVTRDVEEIGYADAGFSYEENPLEAEAFAVQGRI